MFIVGSRMNLDLEGYKQGNLNLLFMILSFRFDVDKVGFSGNGRGQILCDSDELIKQYHLVQLYLIGGFSYLKRLSIHVDYILPV